jgi:hypothetical protein
VLVTATFSFDINNVQALLCQTPTSKTPPSSGSLTLIPRIIPKKSGRAFVPWIAADPAHLSAFRRVEGVWRITLAALRARNPGAGNKEYRALLETMDRVPHVVR